MKKERGKLGTGRRGRRGGDPGVRSCREAACGCLACKMLLSLGIRDGGKQMLVSVSCYFLRRVFVGVLCQLC